MAKWSFQCLGGSSQGLIGALRIPADALRWDDLQSDSHFPITSI